MIDLKNIEFYKNPNDNWKAEIINGRNINIPNDWNKNKINDCGKIITGNTPSTIDNQLWSNFSEYKWISTPNLNNSIIISSNRYLTKKGKEKGRSANKGSLLISCIGSIGECGILKEESFFNQQINAIEFNEYFNNFYLKYFFNYKKNMFQNYVPKSVVPALNKEDFKKFNFYTPLIEEQEKIASILETQENLILSKTELLAKYKKQRKYFQQELLSGRIRMKLNNKSMAKAFELGLIKQTFLNATNEVVEYGGDTITNVNIDIIDKDGFENWLSIDFENKIEFYKNIDFKEIVLNTEKLNIPLDWKKDLIINNLTFQKGVSIPENKMNYLGNGLTYLRSSEVWEDTSSKRDTQYYDKEKIDLIYIKKKKDYLFSLDGFNSKIGEGTLGLLTNKGEGIVSTSFYKLIQNYLYYFFVLNLTTNNIQSFIMKYAEGSTVNHAGKYLKKIEIIKPNNLLETKLISTNFEKIDNLIESLEEEIKLEDKKFTYLKQELLSGRIRVN